MNHKHLKLAALLIASLMVVSVLPLSLPVIERESQPKWNPPETENDIPETLAPEDLNLTNKYDLIWEPNNNRGSTHGVATSPNKNLVAIAGGWLADREVHVYRWSSVSNKYHHVWDSGDGIIQGDVLSVAFADADNNGHLEIVAGSADGRIYVFEQIGVEEGIFYLDGSNNKFELVWDSGEILDQQVWNIEIGDINKDGHTEIIAGVWDGRVYVFELAVHSEWPECPEHYMEFVMVWNSGDVIGSRIYDVEIADTDADRVMEIVASAHNGKVYLFEHVACYPYTFIYKWNSGDVLYNPVRSIAVSNSFDSDQYGEIVAASYGQGVYVFHYEAAIDDFSILKLNRPIDTWELGSLPTTGEYLGAEADPWIDIKLWGWEEHGITEPALIPYPWSSEFIGGKTALGGPPDGNVTTFNGTEDYKFLDVWQFDQGNETQEMELPLYIEFDDEYIAYVADGLNDRVSVISRTGEVLFAFGETGNGTGQFDIPYGLTLSPDGFVYIADAGNQRIHKWTVGGDFVTTFGENGTEVGQYLAPTGVEYGPDGFLYITDAENHRITKISPENGSVIDWWGTNGNAAGQFDGPIDVRISNNGIVYIADSNNDRIQAFDLEGNYLFQWGSFGSGEGQFDAPISLAIDEVGQVYVGDYRNDRIQKFTAIGDYSAQWGISGTEPGQLFRPRGIDFAPDNTAYLIEPALQRIQRFTLESYSVDWTIGSVGNKTGEFHQPFDIEFLEDGTFYVSDGANNRTQRFDQDGTFLDYFNVTSYTGSGTTSSSGIALHPNGLIYVAANAENRILVFDTNGTLLNFWGETGSADGEFNTPIDIEVGSDGLLFVSDAGNNRIQVFNPDGSFVHTFGTGGPGIGEFNLPYGLDYSDGDLLYVADLFNSRIQAFYPNGSVYDVWDTEKAPYGIEVDGAESMYITAYADSSIRKYSQNGNEIAVLTDHIGSYWNSYQPAGPLGIGLDEEQNLYISDWISSKIVKITHEYAFNEPAYATLDWGQYEAITGQATDEPDIYFWFSGDAPAYRNIQLLLSPDGDEWAAVESEQLSSFSFGTAWGPYTQLEFDIDPLLNQQKWREVRYSELRIISGEYYVDAGWGRVSRPMDSALVVIEGHIDSDIPGDAKSEIIVGTTNGAILAYDGENGNMIWESQRDSPRFNFDTSVWDIEELDHRGRMPTFKWDETLTNDIYFNSLGYTFNRFHGYSVGDVDGTSALDMVVTIQDGGISRLLYLRNTGTNENPNLVRISNYWVDNSDLSSEIFVSWAVPTLADLNGDDWLDLVLVTGAIGINGNPHVIDIRYFENNGANYWNEIADQFNIPESYVGGDDLLPKLSFYDMDGDDDLDLTMGLNSTLYYFDNYGSPSNFYWSWDPTIYAGINEIIPDSMAFDKTAFSDFDLDGDIDVTVAIVPYNENHSDFLLDPARSRFSYFENDGTPTNPKWIQRRAIYEPDFTGTALTPEDGFVEPLFRDFTEDGNLDLIGMQDDRIVSFESHFEHNSYIVATYPFIHMLEVDKQWDSYGYDAYASWNNSIISDHWTYSIEFADTDEDGKMEVIVGSFDSNIYAFEQVANNTYRRAWRSQDIMHEVQFGFNTYQVWNDVRDLAVGDQDLDGKQEIIAVAGERILVFENIHNDQYELVWSSGTTVRERISGKASSVDELPIITEITLHNDLDKDGLPEIFIGSKNWILWYENSGDNMYDLVFDHALFTHEGGSPYIQDMITGDSDRDGLQEVIVVGTEQVVNQYGDINYYNGFWTILEANLTADGDILDNVLGESFDAGFRDELLFAVQYADLDEDGRTEVYLGSDIGISIWRNAGDDAFTHEKDFLTESWVRALSVDNTDRDRFMEIIAGVGNSLAVFEHNHTLGLEKLNFDRVWNSTELGNYVTDIAIGDTNHNDRLEILATALEGYVYSFEWKMNASEGQESAFFLSSISMKTPVMDELHFTPCCLPESTHMTIQERLPKMQRFLALCRRMI